ncbi:MAG: S-layer homology domain-containing protein [Cyanobacteria bacterium P01_G01_bin.38]
MSQGPLDRNPDPRRRRLLTSDELIALFVAFTTLGSVLFWGLTRDGINILSQDSQLATELNPAQGTGAGGNGLLGLGSAGLDRADDSTGPQAADLGQIGAPAPATVEDRREIKKRDRNSADESVRRAQRDRAVRPPNLQTPNGGGVAPPINETLPRQQAAQPTEIQAPALETVREALTFQDVPDEYWAKPYVDALSARGLIEGLEEGAFKPDDPVTRAQLARFLTQSFALTPETEALDFNDVATDYWASESIEDAVTGGFMVGFPDETFRPEDEVPRAQVLTALVTGLNTQAAGDVNAAIERYSDADKIPEWAEGKMAAATQAGIVVNHPEISQLAPNQPATRAEVAAMLYQALVYQGRLEPIASEFVVSP